jgi:hypothetical protein
LETSILEIEFNQFSPSILATCCIVISYHTLYMQHWNERMSQFLGYTPMDFLLCLKKLHVFFIDIQLSTNDYVLKKKYSSTANNSVSLLKPRISEITFE